VPDTLPRRAQARALRHPVRATFEKYIHAATGPVSLIELARIAKLEERQVEYHLRILVACHLVDDGDLIRG
jgi:DNA-binding transcriptional ArsR family regulator